MLFHHFTTFCCQCNIDISKIHCGQYTLYYIHEIHGFSVEIHVEIKNGNPFYLCTKSVLNVEIRHINIEIYVEAWALSYLW